MPSSEPDRVRRAKAVAAIAVNVEVRRATRRMPRLARWLTGRNTLRRPVDRIEGAILVAVIAAFAVAVAVASVFGARTYQAQRVTAAGLRPAAAWLTQAGPADDGPGHVGQAQARWSGPAGGEHTGVLTTVTAPDISGAPAGTRIPIWLNPAGEPVPPSSDRSAMIIYALVAGAVAAMVAGMGLLACYGLCRLTLDRRRLAAWEAAWDQTGPSWTRR